MPLPRLVRLLILASLALLVAACGAGKPEVARVGEQDVGEAELRHAVALQRLLADLQGAPCGGQPVAGEREGAACDRIALSAELLWLAVAGYAETNDIAADDAEAEEAVAQLETQVGAEELQQALGTHDLTREDLLELGRRILTLRAVRTAIAEERVGSDDLRVQYEERVLDFTTVQANHILVASEAEAESVYRRVRDATEAQFIALARKVSTEPGADEGGGQLGSAPAAQYAPEFANAVVALEPGEVSRPVQTQFGWHVIYLVDKQVTPYEEAKTGLLGAVADQEFSGWLEDRAAALGVEVDPRYGRFSPETFSVQPTRSTDPSADAGRGSSVSPAP
ncbi:MAG: peptidylprolyl isomerase [Actinomycetota bacterium]